MPLGEENLPSLIDDDSEDDLCSSDDEPSFTRIPALYQEFAASSSGKKKKRRRNAAGKGSGDQNNEETFEFELDVKENDEERQKMREFWLSLGEKERKELVKVEKESVLKKLTESRKEKCECSNCLKQRNMIEEEIELLYDAYCEELETYVKLMKDQQQPLPLSLTLGFTDTSKYTDRKIKNQLMAVADDIANNNCNKILKVMENIAHRKRKMNGQQHHSHHHHHHHQPQRRSNRHEEEYDSEFFEDDDDEDEEDDDGEDEDVDDEQCYEEGRRMFQVFAAKMFEQRVMNAYREKKALEKQQQLLKEEEEEERLMRERELNRQKAKEKKKERKKLLKQQKQEKENKEIEEKLRKEEETKKLKEEQQRLREEMKREQERKQLEEMEKKRLEEDEKKKKKQKKKKQKDPETVIEPSTRTPPTEFVTEPVRERVPEPVIEQEPEKVLVSVEENAHPSPDTLQSSVPLPNMPYPYPMYVPMPQQYYPYPYPFVPQPYYDYTSYMGQKEAPPGFNDKSNAQLDDPIRKLLEKVVLETKAEEKENQSPSGNPDVVHKDTLLKDQPIRVVENPLEIFAEKPFLTSKSSRNSVPPQNLPVTSSTSPTLFNSPSLSSNSSGSVPLKASWNAPDDVLDKMLSFQNSELFSRIPTSLSDKKKPAPIQPPKAIKDPSLTPLSSISLPSPSLRPTSSFFSSSIWQTQ